MDESRRDRTEVDPAGGPIARDVTVGDPAVGDPAVGDPVAAATGRSPASSAQGRSSAVS